MTSDLGVKVAQPEDGSINLTQPHLIDSSRFSGWLGYEDRLIRGLDSRKAEDSIYNIYILYAGLTN